MRNWLLIIALLPVLIFLWLTGWSLFWIGSQSTPQKTKKETRKDGITITTVIPEECLEQHNR